MVKVGVYSLWIDNSAENISWTVKNILEVLPTNCAELTLVETNQLHKIERTISSTRAVCWQVAKEVAALKDLNSINLETLKVPRLVNYQAVLKVDVLDSPHNILTMWKSNTEPLRVPVGMTVRAFWRLICVFTARTHYSEEPQALERASSCKVGSHFTRTPYITRTHELSAGGLQRWSRIFRVHQVPAHSWIGH